MPQKGDCEYVEIAVPLQRDSITLRVQAAPQQFEHARLPSACTVLAPKKKVITLFIN